MSFSSFWKSRRVILAIIFLAGCASGSGRPLTPEIESVKMSRDKPSGECEQIGRVTGTTLHKTATHEELLRDLQDEAARKGANFVQVGEYSSLGTSVTGTAFVCGARQ